MKKLCFVFALLIVASCAKKIEPATVTVSETDTEFIIVRTPVDDITLWNNKADTIYPNEANKFVFQKKIEQPEFIRIIINETYLKAILLPGKSVTVIPAEKKYTFKGENSAGQQFLNDAKRPYFTVNEARKYEKDTTATLISSTINSLKQPELDTLQSFIDTRKIDTDFAEILKKEINYFYAQRTVQAINSKRYKKTTISEDLLALIDETAKTYPLNTTYKSDSWQMYAEALLQENAMFTEMIKGNISKDSMQKYYLEDKLHPYYYQLITSYKDAEIAEKAAATFIIQKAKQEKFEKSLISVYEQFQQDFPNSVYTKYLTEDIEKIKRYHEKIAGAMPANVHFYENEEIASLTEMLPDLKGEKYYVDVWATWCGPCKAEFKYNEPLNAFLKEKGYKKLYISLDKSEQRKKWKQDIKYFDLNGLHLLASQAFFADFEKNHSMHEGYVSIPQYLIIDDGAIVTNNAPRPSQLDELKALLDN
ncbi:MAG: redoxin family protein [Bacteroidota bacterium]